MGAIISLLNYEDKAACFKKDLITLGAVSSLQKYEGEAECFKKTFTIFGAGFLAPKQRRSFSKILKTIYSLQNPERKVFQKDFENFRDDFLIQET